MANVPNLQLYTHTKSNLLRQGFWRPSSLRATSLDLLPSGQYCGTSQLDLCFLQLRAMSAGGNVSLGMCPLSGAGQFGPLTLENARICKYPNQLVVQIAETNDSFTGPKLSHPTTFQSQSDAQAISSVGTDRLLQDGLYVQTACLNQRKLNPEDITPH